ncbi:hypothetical protein ACFYP4_09140 [Streptomyces sp. NPDC005551]|uniref:hypothetical protein n=1 Tax=Streptomyces sp. NPDC005551 TaxID=3364725 RepID=UPI0036A05524
MAVLAVDVDGEVAQAGHEAGKMAGTELRLALALALAERAVADVVQNIFDLPVASDPVRELGTGDSAGRQAGDRVDALDGELSADAAAFTVSQHPQLARHLLRPAWTAFVTSRGRTRP